MKKFFLMAGVFLFLLAGCGQQEKEVYLFSFFQGNGEDGLHLAYSYDGLTWEALNNNQSFLTPQVGGDKLMRDPCVILGPDKNFHMVWTVSWNEKGIGYATSPDLINWSEQKYIPVMKHEPDARNCWAPEVFYDDSSSQYIIFWSTTIPGRFPETESSGDNGYNHRMYYTTTTDFVTFSETSLLYDRGFNVIDGTLAKENGKYILFLKDETRNPPKKNIRIATSTELAANYSNPSEPITGNYWAEGPTAVKIDDSWVVYFDKYTEHRMGAVRSADLVNWNDISETIHFPEGTRHGTVFKAPESVLKKLKAVQLK
ncbi:Glycosyl hydrolases family 43 [Mariniphaga anaerophila]|uniref:Glycosyl hydrolases family 43 n=1 Tax=Mariniphaga anaerophila TaxID=1484053 RepID=A0A1M4XL39_9BACT|nr:glycoside hydrolase family 43 protein [Mariniphaga anaerophila]SHE94189.1 Glycosyl hydrolases family 43 [Mariniphaga anaerophila]